MCIQLHLLPQLSLALTTYAYLAGASTILNYNQIEESVCRFVWEPHEARLHYILRGTDCRNVRMNVDVWTG
jgi:hypothetical protein